MRPWSPYSPRTPPADQQGRGPERRHQQSSRLGLRTHAETNARSPLFSLLDPRLTPWGRPARVYVEDTPNYKSGLSRSTGQAKKVGPTRLVPAPAAGEAAASHEAEQQDDDRRTEDRRQDGNPGQPKDRK